METERPEIERTQDGGEGAGRPALAWWWFLLVIVVGGVGFGALSALLGLAFDLPRDSFPGIAALVMFTTITTLSKPGTVRQLGLVAAVGAATGLAAMAGYLPVALFAQGLEGATESFLVRLLGVALATGLAGFLALLTVRRLGVSLPLAGRTEDRS